MYSTDNVPSGAPPFSISSNTENSKDDHSTSSVPIAFVAAAAGASLLLLGTAVILSRSSRRKGGETSAAIKRYRKAGDASAAPTEPSESLHEDMIEFNQCETDGNGSLFDTPFASSHVSDNKNDEDDSWVQYSDDEPWWLRDD